jgi:hypothetical protein
MIMALFFQLLTEEELGNLTVEQLARLRAAFYHELYTNEAIRRELSARIARALETMGGDQGQEPQTNDDASGC